MLILNTQYIPASLAYPIPQVQIFHVNHLPGFWTVMLCDIVRFLLSPFLCICIISVFVYLNFEMVKMQREQGLSVTHVRPPLPLRHMTLARPNPCVKPCPGCPDAAPQKC